ncbi:MAG: TonB-dependent receptor, partial [Bacteroidales bacterium]|nr:TonB-dependent receptor [Bacteroidales bacterium]
MKKHKLLRILAFVAIVILSASYCEAQPGGPGGRPGGGYPGGRPGGRPPMGNRDWNQMGNDQNAQQVKQKKKVKEGDTFKVVGSLRDSVSGEFLSYVNVAVLDSADSAFIKGAPTNLDGLFEIQGIPAGAYILRVTAIGYQKLFVPFKVSNNTALGTIKVKPGSQTLNEVTVTAERPLYAMDGEKLIYNVSDDPSIQTGTTEDALQNAPGVEVDVEGNITLRGVSSVEIWINDKPSKLTEENLKTYLQTLPANALARIETITNPSAKYATSAEAVINIITTAHIKSNQFVSFGVNGSNQPFVSPWVSYMWAKEKLSFNLFASGRYSYRDNTSEGWSMQRQDHAGGVHGEDYDTVMYQGDTSESHNRSYSGNFFASLNYEIDSMQELSVDAGGFYNYNRSLSERITNQEYYLPSAGTIAYDIYDSTLSPSMMGHAGADWTKKFDKEGHNLRMGINTRLSHNASDEWYSRDYTTYTLPGYNATDENRYLMTRNYNYGASFDLRYNRPYSKDGEMSYGLRLEYESSDASFDRWNDRSQASVDSLRTYRFLNSTVAATADVNWTHRWGGFTLSSGLGATVDNESIDYQTSMPFADKGSKPGFSLRPSVHLSYRTEDMHNLKLNYSMRMQNPSATQESRFRRYGEDSYSTGNINGLRDAFTHSME